MAREVREGWGRAGSGEDGGARTLTNASRPAVAFGGSSSIVYDSDLLTLSVALSSASCIDATPSRSPATAHIFSSEMEACESSASPNSMLPRANSAAIACWTSSSSFSAMPMSRIACMIAWYSSTSSTFGTVVVPDRESSRNFIGSASGRSPDPSRTW